MTSNDNNERYEKELQSISHKLIVYSAATIILVILIISRLLEGDISLYGAKLNLLAFPYLTFAISIYFSYKFYLQLQNTEYGSKIFKEKTKIFCKRYDNYRVNSVEISARINKNTDDLNMRTIIFKTDDSRIFDFKNTRHYVRFNKDSAFMITSNKPKWLINTSLYLCWMFEHPTYLNYVLPKWFFITSILLIIIYSFRHFS